MNYQEEEFLYGMISESNEEVRNSLYEKYQPLIRYYVQKYYKFGKTLGLDYSDLMQEANVAFTNAINNYDKDRGSLNTFIINCIEKKMINVIRMAQGNKNKIMQDALSLDYDYDGMPFMEMIGNEENDPFIRYSEKESMEDFKMKMKEVLSSFELEVFQYMLKGLNYKEIAEILDKSPKQIDNTIHRVRVKAQSLRSEDNDKKECETN